MVKVGTINEQITEQIFAMFKPVEGFNCVYYGPVRNGKTYNATADIVELLELGERVVANWKVDFQGYDQRSSFRIAFLKFLTGRRDFFSFDRSNFEFIPPQDLLAEDGEAVKRLNKMVNVHVFIDEGQWLFNSQDRFPSPDKLELILHGGHYCRSLNIITQRPSNIFKTMRSQINIWYKCEKRLSWPFVIFQRTEFQDMKDDLPDEDKPVGRPKTYFADDRIFNMYNTHAMRKDDADYRLVNFTRYETTFFDRLVLVVSFLLPRWLRSRFDALVEARYVGAPRRGAVRHVTGNEKSIRQVPLDAKMRSDRDK